MKTEDFDDAIRRKIASIESAHDEKDVDTIHYYVRNQSKNRSKRKAIIIISTLATFIIGGLFTWNVLQIKEIAGLRQKVTELKSPKAFANPKEENRISISGNQNSAIYKKTRNALANTINDKSHLGVSFKKPGISLAGENFINTGPVAEPKENFAAEDQSLTLPGEPTQDLALPDRGVEKTKPALDSLTVKSVLDEASGGLVTDSSVTLVNPEPKFPKNWHYGLGIGLEAGRLQLGFAFLGEAIFKEKWVIGIGIKVVKNGTQNFDDDDDYNDKKKNTFRSVYSNHVSDGSNKNIAIKNVILQVPLNLNYILPIKRNFALLAGAGTDIDLYVRQDVDYKHANGATEYQSKKFATNYPPVLINNVVLTVGLQKTIHRLTFQFTPYLSPQIKQVDYKKENLYYGLRFKTFFTF